ncbi:MAG TPA: glycosyltransferase family 2 protein [Tepidisphaeraceae bacterium]|nr:glycosyltransferase family 2 protein [Tepidisphaeraceae bacterium]
MLLSDKSKMELLIVIVCYKVVDMTIDCLRSLEAEIATIPGAKVAVCENGTGGDAYDRLDRAITENGWGSWVELTSVTPNRGFTGGNNHVIGAALASSDPPKYVVLLNADTIVIQGAIAKLLEFMEKNPKVGIAGSRLESPDGHVQGSPFRFQGIASEFDRGLRLGLVSKLLRPWSVTLPSPTYACEVPWLAGASMIIRREVFGAIGMLDEGYYTYFDDIDYCLNAQRSGWPTWFVPESRIIHLEGCSTGIASHQRIIPKRRPKYWFDARRRFFLKNYGAIYSALVDFAFITGFALWRLRRWLTHKPDTDPPHMLGDSIRYSVFFQGFKVREVQNPAMMNAININPQAVKV